MVNLMKLIVEDQKSVLQVTVENAEIEKVLSPGDTFEIKINNKKIAITYVEMYSKVDQWNAFSSDCKYFDEDSIFWTDTSTAKNLLFKYIDSITDESLDENKKKEVAIEIAYLAFMIYCETFVDKSCPGMVWQRFSELVIDHIQNYVAKQYRDFPDYIVEKYNEAKIQAKLEAYADRIGSGLRGEEDQKRDLIKIAHYACYFYAFVTKGNAAAEI